MKTDANALRQKSHDDCKRLVSCPKCNAPRTMSCRNRVRDGNGRVYPSEIWAKSIGGLHKERWSALTKLDVVTRLSEIA